MTMLQLTVGASADWFSRVNTSFFRLVVVVLDAADRVSMSILAQRLLLARAPRGGQRREQHGAPSRLPRGGSFFIEHH